MFNELPQYNKLVRIFRESHERSKSYNIDTQIKGSPEHIRLTNQELNDRREKLADFYTIARAQLESLYELLKGTGFCMVIADKDGYVLCITGDDDLKAHFQYRCCLPGYRWTEKDVGTCAIGLALREKIDIYLPGELMYAVPAKKITNTSSPIFAPESDEVLGCICLSGYSTKMHIHTLGLVSQASKNITSQLQALQKQEEIAIKNRYLVTIVESKSSGIITVNPKGDIVHSNNKARAILNFSTSSLSTKIHDYIECSVNLLDAMKRKKGFRTMEVFSIKKNIRYFASFDLIHGENDTVVGGVLTLVGKNEALRQAVQLIGTQTPFTFDSILGESATLKAAIRLAKISAKNSAPVLLNGETGTGKELFAQSIHNASEQSQGSFIAINCGAIPKELLESELFGYVEGAFTGAQKGGRPGKIELANGGTLFLDEIGDMPLEMQVKLLRVLQFGEIQRVGDFRTIPVQFRVITATHKDLSKMIEEQQFREDLYYRISTLKIVIPPLRERLGDIVPLANFFVNRHKIPGAPLPPPLPEETGKVLTAYHWPGNIRQLESATERAVHLSENGTILPEHFGISDLTSQNSQSTAPFQTGERLEDIEARAIKAAIILHDNNLSKAAKALGIARPTLYRKIEKYGLNITKSLESNNR